MNKLITVLPNFSILIDFIIPEFFDTLDRVGLYVEKGTIGDKVKEFILTPQSYWKGLNLHGVEKDFIEILKENSKNEVPQNIIAEINNWNNRFGKIILLSGNILKIKDIDLFNEIINHSKLKEYIISKEDDLIFLNNYNLEIKHIVENELGYGIRIIKNELKSWIVEIVPPEDEEFCLTVRAKNPKEALRKVFSKHIEFSIDSLKIFKEKKKVDEKDFNEYIDFVFEYSTGDGITEIFVRLIPEVILDPLNIFGRKLKLLPKLSKKDFGIEENTQASLN